MSQLANHAILGASYQRGYARGRDDIQTPKLGKLDASGQITAEAMIETADWLVGIQLANEWTTHEQWLWDMLLSAGEDEEAAVSVARMVQSRPEFGDSLKRLEGKAFVEGMEDAFRDYLSDALWTEFLDMHLHMENQLRRFPLAHLLLIALLLPGAADMKQLSERHKEAALEWKRTAEPRCELMSGYAAAVGGVQ